MILVKVELKETSQVLEIKNVLNTYQKWDMFCIMTNEEVVKYPINNIFRIKEINIK